ncbi:MAG: hypothetical protein GY679_02000 [Mycoplasma sp.]|nr:hypothetical protein [Mycoplasma sp.]
MIEESKEFFSAYMMNKEQYEKSVCANNDLADAANAILSWYRKNIENAYMLIDMDFIHINSYDECEELVFVKVDECGARNYDTLFSLDAKYLYDAEYRQSECERIRNIEEKRKEATKKRNTEKAKRRKQYEEFKEWQKNNLKKSTWRGYNEKNKQDDSPLLWLSI